MSLIPTYHTKTPHFFPGIPQISFQERFKKFKDDFDDEIFQAEQIMSEPKEVATLALQLSRIVYRKNSLEKEVKAHRRIKLQHHRQLKIIRKN